jgi:hypothetical protein
MVQPSEPDEAAAAQRAAERSATPPGDPEAGRVEARRHAQDGPADEPPDRDWLRSNAAWLPLAAIVLALVAWVVYVQVG